MDYHSNNYSINIINSIQLKNREKKPDDGFDVVLSDLLVVVATSGLNTNSSASNFNPILKNRVFVMLTQYE
jgi:hypothetical protein